MSMWRAAREEFLDVCSRYTGIDFSLTGLQTARSTLSGSSTPTRFLNADVCALPFANDSFDAVYCAHMMYRIDSVGSQNDSWRTRLSSAGLSIE
jgi:ubiquinone/menaquinone biosynthesis C-methylase UbiE